MKAAPSAGVGANANAATNSNTAPNASSNGSAPAGATQVTSVTASVVRVSARSKRAASAPSPIVPCNRPGAMPSGSVAVITS